MALTFARLTTDDTHGYGHHIAINRSQVARVLQEVFSNYLGIDVYWHT